MNFREATIEDIEQIQFVRNSVRENVLSHPGLIPDKAVQSYLFERGKGWVCEVGKVIVGFAIADLTGHNIWALFILPEFEGKGIGRKLHSLMLNWYFGLTNENLWLSTAPGSRAETFYKKLSWQQTGLHGKGDIKFEMTAQNWINLKEQIN